MAQSATASPQTPPAGTMLDRQRRQILELLTKAYWMEIETVISYLAASINPDGVRAREIASALRDEVDDELTHARRFGERIKELYGVVPGSMDFKPEQAYLQPPEQQTDLVHIVGGVIEAERGTIEHYNRIINETDGLDWVTNDMTIEILHDEERHRRLFEGFMRELIAG
jgi:bacterioferritin